MKAVRVHSRLPANNRPQCILGLQTRPRVFSFSIMVACGLDTKSRFKVVSIQVVSSKVYLTKVKTFSPPWRKERRIFIQFFFHAQTILEANETFVQFHCLSSYRIDLYRNNFCIETTSFQPMTSLCLQPVYG